MTKLGSTLVSKPKPLQQTKQATLSALEPLTRSEIDALRQKKKHVSDYYQKVLRNKLVP